MELREQSRTPLHIYNAIVTSQIFYFYGFE